MSAPDYNSPVFAAWRAANTDVWRAFTTHPFVSGLGDGSLPRKAFIHYLIQDYVFLVHFSRAWALAIVKSKTMEEMKIATGTVDALVNHEMQLHIETCAKEGISEDQLFSAIEEPENMAYTRYVTATGLTGDFLDMMAALSPCVFGYGEVGLNLAQPTGKNTSYRDWINTYASEEYQILCRTVAAMIENATRSRLGDDFMANPRWSNLCETFGNATRLEVGFWDMAMRG